MAKRKMIGEVRTAKGAVWQVQAGLDGVTMAGGTPVEPDDASALARLLLNAAHDVRVRRRRGEDKKHEKPAAMAFIGDGQIVIRVPFENLPMAVALGPLGHGAKVTDAIQFAYDVVQALNHEEEDGTTPIHHLLDEACEKAIEDGSEGIELVDGER